MKSSFQAKSVAQITGADLNFCSMKRQGVLRLPPDGMPVHGRFPPPPTLCISSGFIAGISLYSRGERGAVKRKRLPEHMLGLPTMELEEVAKL